MTHHEPLESAAPPTDRASLELPPADGELRIVPLGGLGEIGMNCLALESAQGVLIVDCGIMFPDEDLGVDVYYPDFSFLEAEGKRLCGVFLTHGHEDHVGALPYLLDRFEVPVWGPPHALAVARHRLEEHALPASRVRLNVATPGHTYSVGPFEVEPIRVTHSVVDATALAVRTQAGTIVHTGDFKFDPDPPDSERTDEARLARIGAEGVDALLSDSTNIDAHADRCSEAVVVRSLDAILSGAKRRVVIGMFASNLHRIRAVGDICRRLGRKIALFGRSLELSVQWGHELGRLDWPDDLFVARDRAASVPPESLVILAGGTQAEPTSALTQLAAGTHPALKLAPGDLAVLSSRIIPGNDHAVFGMMAGLLRQGVIVRNWITDPELHVSGHAYRSEQAKMIDLVRPRNFIPVHGTLHHLVRHADLARERGVANVVVLEDGDVASLRGGHIARIGHTPVGRVATWSGIDLPDEVLSQRRALARAGALHVSVVLDRHGRLAARPVIWARGVIVDEQNPETLRPIALEVAKALNAMPTGVRAPSDEGVAETARVAARRAVESRTGRKPVCSATVVRMD